MPPCLLRLPVETLRHIFEYLGAPFFQQDVRRLTVCKQWFVFALPALLQSLTFSEERLHHLVTAAGGKQTYSGLRDHLQELNIVLGDYRIVSDDGDTDDRVSIPDLPEARRAPEFPSLLIPATEAGIDLNHSLGQLASVLQPSRKLRHLRIRASSKVLPETTHNSEAYLSIPTLQQFLSVENLRVLVLDLCADVEVPAEPQDLDCHICPAISRLLSKLHTLHIRMRKIYPDILKVEDQAQELSIRNLVINLSLKGSRPDLTSASHAKQCGSPDGGLLRLKEEMRQRAETITERMDTPISIRLLTHSLPLFETYSLDVRTGKETILEDGAEWDSAGKCIEGEESDSESELSENEFLTYLD